MYLLPGCSDARGYFPINTKWGGTSSLSGLLPGGGLRGVGCAMKPSMGFFQRPQTLSYFRPNFAMARGNYPGNQFVGAPAMGDAATDALTSVSTGSVAVDPTLMLAGVGLLALGTYLLGRPKKRQVRKRPGKIRRTLQVLSE